MFEANTISFFEL